MRSSVPPKPTEQTSCREKRSGSLSDGSQESNAVPVIISSKHMNTRVMGNPYGLNYNHVN